MKITKKFDNRIYFFYFLLTSLVLKLSMNLPLLDNNYKSKKLNDNMRNFYNLLSISDERELKYYNKFFIFDFFLNENFKNVNIIDNYQNNSNEDYLSNIKNFYKNAGLKYKNSNNFENFSFFSRCKSKNTLFEDSCNIDHLNKINKILRFIKTKYGEYCSSFYEEILCMIHCGKKANENIIFFEEDIYSDKKSFYIKMSTCKNFLSKCQKIKIFDELDFNEDLKDILSCEENNHKSNRIEISNYPNFKNLKQNYRILDRTKNDLTSKEFKKKLEKNQLSKFFNSIYTNLCLNQIGNIGQFNNNYILKISENDSKDDKKNRVINKGLDIYDLDCKIESSKYYEKLNYFEEILDYENREILEKRDISIQKEINQLSKGIEKLSNNKSLNKIFEKNFNKNIDENNKDLSDNVRNIKILSLIRKEINIINDINYNEKKLNNYKIIINDEIKFTQNIFLNSSSLNLDFYTYENNYDNIINDFILSINKVFIEIFGKNPLFNFENIYDETYLLSIEDFKKNLKDNFLLLKKRIEFNFSNFKKINPSYLNNIYDGILDNNKILFINIQKYYIYIIEYILFVEPFNNNIIHSKNSESEIIKRRIILFDYLQNILFNFFKDVYLKNYNKFSFEDDDFDPLIVIKFFFYLLFLFKKFIFLII